MNSSNSHQPKPPGKRSRGAILKEARKAQGFSLDKIHEETKIPLDVLKAIEEGYTVRTLSPFYFKGFVKMYAQYLEVDPARVIDDYHKEELPAPEEEKPKKEEKRRFEEEPKIEFPVFDFQEFLTPGRKEFLVKGIGILIVLFVITRIFGCVKDRAKNKEIKKAAVVEKVEEKAQEKEVSPPKPVREEAKVPSPRLVKDEETGEIVQRAANSGAPGAGAPQQEEGIRLTVNAKRKGWLQVKVDGSVVFQSTLNEGTSETWKADESIELSGKLIHYLDYKVNGKDIGGLGRDARNARRLVVNEKGMFPK